MPCQCVRVYAYCNLTRELLDYFPSIISPHQISKVMHLSPYHFTYFKWLKVMWVEKKFDLIFVVVVGVFRSTIFQQHDRTSNTTSSIIIVILIRYICISKQSFFVVTSIFFCFVLFHFSRLVSMWEIRLFVSFITQNETMETTIKGNLIW